MVSVTLNLKKTIEANAADYFERAKKAKKKIHGAKQAIQKWQDELKKLEKQLVEIGTACLKTKTLIPKKWFHTFRWFRTSDNFLVIGGRDATTNEIVIKKKTEPSDLVFHTDMAGSPFFVVKSDGREITETAIRETADATCTFSRAWKLGLGSQDVFYVRPEQITKTPMTGEYLQKGAFMIIGKTNYSQNKVNLAVGIDKDGVMAAPAEAVKAHCKDYIILEQGNEKTSTIAKEIKKRIGGDLDAIIRALPAGGCRIKSYSN